MPELRFMLFIPYYAKNYAKNYANIINASLQFILFSGGQPFLAGVDFFFFFFLLFNANISIAV